MWIGFVCLLSPTWAPYINIIVNISAFATYALKLQGNRIHIPPLNPIPWKSTELILTWDSARNVWWQFGGVGGIVQCLWNFINTFEETRQMGICIPRCDWRWNSCSQDVTKTLINSIGWVKSLNKSIRKQKIIELKMKNAIVAQSSIVQSI